MKWFHGLLLGMLSALGAVVLVLLRPLLRTDLRIVNPKQVIAEIKTESEKAREEVRDEIENATADAGIVALPNPERVNRIVDEGRDRFHDSVRNILGRIRPINSLGNRQGG